jgi:hypothetical protein
VRAHASVAAAVLDSSTSRRFAWFGGFALLAVAAWLGLTAAPAAAACSNETVRLAQGATWLPDCRAYEMVSPVNKNGGEIVTRFDGLATDGNAVGFGSNGVFAGAQGGVAGTYRAQRGAEGWETASIVPPFGTRNALILDGPDLVAGSDDFGRALFQTAYPVDPRDQSIAFRNTTTSEDRRAGEQIRPHHAGRQEGPAGQQRRSLRGEAAGRGSVRGPEREGEQEQRAGGNLLREALMACISLTGKERFASMTCTSASTRPRGSSAIRSSLGATSCTNTRSCQTARPRRRS